MKLSSLNKGLGGSWNLDSQHYNPATKRFTDATPNENNGVSANAVNFVADRMGQPRATRFNGTTDVVRIPDSESLSPTSAITVMCWVKGASQNYKPIISHYDAVVDQRAFNIRASRFSPYNNFMVVLSDNGEYAPHVKEYLSSIVVFDNAWHLIGFTFNAGILKLYVDGVEDTNPTKLLDPAIITIHNSTADVMIGCYLSSDTPTSFFNGDLADLRIYNRVITQQEITSLYEQYRPKISLGSLMKGLVFDMPLNSKRYNAGNSKFDDLTPYENRGTNSGGDVDTDHTTFISANNDCVRIPDSESLSPTSAITVMCWVKGEVQYNKGILTHYDSGATQRTFLWRSKGSKFGITISDNGTVNSGHIKQYSSSIVTFDNAWHLIGFSFDAGTLKLFVDGVEDTNPTKPVDYAITTIHNSTADVMLGGQLNSDTPAYFFDGDLAKPKMWNRALSDAEWKLAFDMERGLFL